MGQVTKVQLSCYLVLLSIDSVIVHSSLMMHNYIYIYIYGSGHEGVAVLLPGFAINW